MRFQAHRENVVDFARPQLQFKSATAQAPDARTPIVDRVLALFALIFTSPLLLLLGFCIRIGGQDPIFVQYRVGKDCKPFRIFKFRTIPNNGWTLAEQAADKSLLARLRLSVFRQVSRILRATGLDELPQFVNILKGDMQIIGPRPLIPDDFNALPEGREVRCVVVPGITGLAQINGGQDLDPVSKLALDLYVIDHLSLRIMAKILMRTVLRIFGGTSATATVCSVDLAHAREHMAQRMRHAAIAVPEALVRTEVPTRPRKKTWLALPTKTLRPIRFSSHRTLNRASNDVPTRMKKGTYAVVEDH